MDDNVEYREMAILFGAGTEQTTRILGTPEELNIFALEIFSLPRSFSYQIDIYLLVF